MHLERSEDEEEAGEHQAGEGHEVEAGQGLGQPLVVASESLEACNPGEGTPSRQGESHPLPLTEPCIHLSAYTARDVHTAVPGCGQPCELLPQKWLAHTAVPDAPPPSLRPHYRASSLLRGGPPLCPASVLYLSLFRQFEDLPSMIGRVARGRSSRIAARVPRGQPSSSERQVPKFHTSAQATLAPPVCRTPPGQYAGCPQAVPEASNTPRF